jgi:hypothetical protein
VQGRLHLKKTCAQETKSTTSNKELCLSVSTPHLPSAFVLREVKISPAPYNTHKSEVAARAEFFLLGTADSALAA